MAVLKMDPVCPPHGKNCYPDSKVKEKPNSYREERH